MGHVRRTGGDFMTPDWVTAGDVAHVSGVNSLSLKPLSSQ